MIREFVCDVCRHGNCGACSGWAEDDVDRLAPCECECRDVLRRAA